MKRSRWLSIGLGVVALLAVAVALRFCYQAPNAGERETPASALSSVDAGPAAAAPQPKPALGAVPPAAQQPAAAKVASVPPPSSVLAQAHAWAERFAASPSQARPALIAEGEPLLKARYQEMARLAQADPKRALALAFPYQLRKALPASLSAYVEQPVSGRGDFKVILSSPLRGTASGDLTPQYAVTLGNKRYQAFTYGSRIRQPSRKHVPLHGIALADDRGRPIMALSADALRAVDPAEAKDLAVANKAPANATCPVCGSSVAGAARACVAELGGEYLAFDQPSHLQAYNAQANQALMTSWPTPAADAAAKSIDVPEPVLFPQQTPQAHIPGMKGIKRLLYMPVLFADDPVVPESQDDAQRACAVVARNYKENSYGSVNWLTTITPPMRLPQCKSAYADGISGDTPVSVFGDGLAAARALGYVDSYDDMYVIFNSVAPVATFGGRSDGLINGAPGALTHEIGHSTFGWIHANYLDLSGTAPGPPNGRYPVDPDSAIGHADVNAPLPMPIDVPQMIVYGDPYDIMGGGGSHFSVIFKNQENWLTDNRVRFINSNQTNRIYAFDVSQIFEDRLYALRVRKDYDKDYWISHRQAFSDNPWMSRGVEVQWASASSPNTLLLDTMYSTSYGKYDGAVTIGRTFADTPAHIFITPVAQGGDSPTNSWVDVVVNIGPFPDNNSPVVSLAASALQVDLGQSVKVTATAQDPDGDVLAYNWDYGDLRFGPNSPDVTVSWDTEGQYVVRCDVSDMKGGITIAYVVVTVGNPSTRTISGRITDSVGRPIQGVRVHNGVVPPADPPAPQEGADPTTPPAVITAYRYSYTDNNGYYTIGNVPQGRYTVGAFLFGFKMEARFANPLPVSGGNATDIDFRATPITKLTVRTVKDAPESGLTPEGETNSGIVRITRYGDIRKELPVLFRVDGTARLAMDYLEWLGSWWTNIIIEPGDPPITNYIPHMEQVGHVTIPAGSAFVDMPVTAIPNDTGNGNQSVIFTLLLATNDFRITSYLTNLITTNYVNDNTNFPYLVTNTAQIFVTNEVTIPGWELLPAPPTNGLAWFQVPPTYVLSNAETTLWIIDDDPPNKPTVSVQAIGDMASEINNDNGMFMFTRNNAPMTNELKIRFSIGGTASNGLDYATLPTEITIKPGESFALLPVEAFEDLFVENAETIQITLLPDPAYGVGARSATVTILDANLPQVIVYSPDSVAGRDGANTGRATVMRTGSTKEPLTVNYQVSGTAVSGVDFLPLSQTVTVPANSLTADIVVRATTNAGRGSRTVIIQLSDSPVYNIEYQNSAIITIQDALPVVTLTHGADVTEGNSTTFTVSRDGPTNASLMVYFEVGGTAFPNADYAPLGTNVLIPAGATNAVITLAARDDASREYADMFGDRTVIVQLLAGPNYNLGDPNNGTVRVLDNDAGKWPRIGFMLSDSYVREGTPMHLVLIKSSANPAEGTMIHFEYHVTGGTAIQGIDYDLGTWMGTNIEDFVIINEFGFQTNADSITNIGHFWHYTPPQGPAAGPDFFHPEDTIGYIPIAIYDDGLATGNKTIELTLFDPDFFRTNYVVFTNQVVIDGKTNRFTYTNMFVQHSATNAEIGAYATHLITVEDAGIITVDVAAEVPDAYESGLKQGRFVISRSGGSLSKALKVTYAMTGTAAPGNDYVGLATNGRLATITIPAGTNRVVLPVVPINDPEEEMPEQITLTIISQQGYTPGNASATINLISEDGTVQFLVSRYEVWENATNAVIAIQRTGDTNRAVTVEYQISDGTASNGVDYLGTNGTLLFAAGQTLQTFTIPILDNHIVEPDKTVRLSLRNPTGGVPLGGQSQAALVILNDDVAFEFATNTYLVNENGTNASIVVLRLGLTNDPVNVLLGTTDGAATNGLDYLGITNRVQFAAGQVTQTVLVPITDDILFETNETVQLLLSDPGTNTYLGALTNAALVILDDECMITFTSTNFLAWEYAPVAEITVARLGGAVNPVSVEFYTLDGTASNSVDYLSTNGTILFRGNEWVIATNGSGLLEFHPGETNKTLVVSLLDDQLGEGNESFRMILTNLTGPPDALPRATLYGQTSNTLVTILDNEMPGNVDYEYMNPGVSLPGLGINGPVFALAVQADGQCVVGGNFTTVDGILYNRIARMQSNGVPDPFFNPGYGANGTVYAVAVQKDNHIVVGGAFTRMDTTNSAGIARLRANGEIDPTFNTRGGLNSGEVRALAIQNDGMILLAGSFDQVGGSPGGNIARLTSDGSVDGGFSCGVQGQVFALAVQPDGRILVGGAFTNIGGAVRQCIARLGANGAVDPSFTPVSLLDGTVYSLALQADGRVVVGGAFTHASGLPYAGVVRLNSDGTVDASFDPGTGVKSALAESSPTPAALESVPAAASESRIVGGKGATIDQFPYQVAILSNPYHASNIWNDQFCGGSILDKSWILTAAHCMYGERTNAVAVAVGVTDLTHPQQGRVFLVDQIIVHPGYDPATYQNDVALIHLATPIDFAAGYVAAPVQLVSPADALAGVTATGVLSTITGWGNTSGAGAAVYPTNLQVATVPITATSAYLPGEITAEMIMAGYVQGGIDTCQGDSGGPLVVTNSAGTILQAGITSWGDGCARPNYPGVYTRVSRFYDWIKAYTGSGTPITNEQPKSIAVYAVAIDAFGRILIGGNFTNYNDSSRNNFARLNGNGSLDYTFDIGSGANDAVRALAVQPDTAIVMGGDFTVVDDLPAGHIVRIHGNDKWTVTSIAFASAVFRVREDRGPAYILVQRSGNSNGTVRVNFSTTDGTAVNPRDYTGYTNTLTFASGEMLKTNIINIFDDHQVQGNKTVQLALFDAPLNVDLGAQPSALLVIEDAGKAIRFARTNFTVYEDQTNAVVDVAREGNLDGEVSVLFRTFPGTATAGLDYTEVQSNLVFAAGQTNISIDIPVVFDGTEEVVETVFLVLTNPIGATLLSPSNSTLKILDAIIPIGGPDPSFDPGTGAGGAGHLVRSLALYQDGRILVGGAFNDFNGVARNYVTRLFKDGSQDLSFNPGTGPNGMVSCVAVLTNGKAMLGGSFTAIDGRTRNYVGRLNVDGALDTGFDQLSGLNGSVASIAVETGTRYLVGGGFTQPIPYLDRIRGDGSPDITFGGLGPNGNVHSVCLYTNGASLWMLAAGSFSAYNGQPIARLARLSMAGLMDSSFQPPAPIDGVVFALGVDKQNRILIGGSFTNVGGSKHPGLARLNIDGSLDETFAPEFNGTVYTVAVQADGKVLVGGSFTTVNQTNRGNYVRLLANGAIEERFATGSGANGTVYSILPVPSGGVLIGGAFNTVDSLPRAGVALLIGDPPLPLRLQPLPGTTGEWTVGVSTTPGLTYVYEATVDFLTWTEVTRFVATGYYTVLTDPLAFGFNTRFYRVRLLNP